jgi:hypothetical protein
MMSKTEELEKENKELRELVAIGEMVVEDFMPNIGQCVLQDYGRLNTFLTRAREVRLETRA